jgi:outer membrane protein assembly factor BamB
VWGDRIFVSGVDRQASKFHVLCIDRRKGTIVWDREIPVDKFETVHDVSSPATATPATDGERVYAYFGSFGLIAFDFGGAEAWRVPMPVADVAFGSGTSPVISGDLLILNRDVNGDPHLLAVERRTGKTVWKGVQTLPERKPFGGSKATPVVWQNEIVVHRGGEVVGFDLKTGARKWWVQTATQGTGTPVVAGDAIYVGTWMNRGEPDLRTDIPSFDELLKNDTDRDGAMSLAEMPASLQIARRVDVVGVKGADFLIESKDVLGFLDKNKDGKLDAAEWGVFTSQVGQSRDHGLLAVKPGGTGDVTLSNVLWKEPRGVPEIPTPLALKDRVYMVTNGGIVSCMDAATGKLLFRDRLGAGGPYYASPVAAGGRIYFSSGDGVVSVIEHADQMQVVGRNDLGEPIFATPAIVDGTIYVRSPRSLYAFRK